MSASSSATATTMGCMSRAGRGIPTFFSTYHGHRAGLVTEAMVADCLRGDSSSTYCLSEMCLFQTAPRELHGAVTTLRTCLVRALVEETTAFRQPSLVLNFCEHIRKWDAIPVGERRPEDTRLLALAFAELRAAEHGRDMMEVHSEFIDQHSKCSNKRATGSPLVEAVWIDGKDDDRLRRYAESLVQKKTNCAETFRDYECLFLRCRTKEAVEEASDDSDDGKKKKKAKMVRKYTSGRHFGAHTSPDYLLWDLLLQMAEERKETEPRLVPMVKALGELYSTVSDHKNAWVFGAHAVMAWIHAETLDFAPHRPALTLSESAWMARLEKHRAKPTRELTGEAEEALFAEAAADRKKKRKQAPKKKKKDDDDEEEEEEIDSSHRHAKRTKYVSFEEAEDC